MLQAQQFEPVGSNKTQTVDVRVVLASNMDLETEVEAGRFREDLFYRINVVTIEMPTLAERIGDLPLLAEHFLEHSCAEMKRDIFGFRDAAMQTLCRYNSPGNVRELDNVIESVDLYEPSEPYKPMPLKQALEQPEKRILEAALRANDWNRQLTAEQLGINRTTLYKKMKRYGLDREPAQTR